MEHLYIGIKGYVVCLCKQSGKEIWRTKIKSMANITNVSLDESKLYAYAGGYLFCLDADSGEIKWENGLDGLGHGYCIIASKAGNQQEEINSMAAQDSSTSSS